MKIFLSEYRHDYSTYTFGYTIYALYESRQDLDEIYANGFLPYTGNPDLEYNLFYKSRGLRVDLASFTDTSENRRVNRKVLESLDIHFEIIPIEEFRDWDALLEFAKNYSEDRIGEHKMPPNRIEYIVKRPYLTHIIRFSHKDQIVGYILAVITDQAFHYWFSFYDTVFISHQIPLGKWLMWRCIHLAKEMNCQHAYLGNSYLPAALYKSRDFKSIEYYDGNGWSTDLKKLHKLCNEDVEMRNLDDLKLAHNVKVWIDNKI